MTVAPFDVIGATLSVASAVKPGITRLFSEFVHLDEGSKFHILSQAVPSVLADKSFSEALQWFSERDIILVGVESDELRDSYLTRHGDGSSQSIKIRHIGVCVNPKDAGYITMTLLL